MPLAFFLDTHETRSELRRFALGSRQAFLMSGKQSQGWDGELPSRSGDYFYESPWLLFSGKPDINVPAFLEVFSADTAKNLESVWRALECVEKEEEWAIFPWGGYARYGMLGLIASITSLASLSCSPIFHYGQVSHFGLSYKGVISRRGLSPFAPSIWRGIQGEKETPLIVSFEYYEEAFEGAELSFSVQGSFREADDSKTLSIYRMNDYAAFAHFAGMANQVFPFDILPGRLGLAECEKTRHLTSRLDFSGALHVTPWFLSYNAGEIDTNNVLFAASAPSMTAHFVKESADSLSHISYF